MNEEQAKKVLEAVNYFSGNTEDISIEAYQVFLKFFISPLFFGKKNKDRRKIFEKYGIFSDQDFVCRLIELKGPNFFVNFITKCTERTNFKSDFLRNPIRSASRIAYFARNGLWNKIKELEKSLKTQLYNALKHKDFEHSGETGSPLSSRNIWPCGKKSWEVLDGSLEIYVKSGGIVFPSPSVPAVPADGTQLPHPKDIRSSIHDIFGVAQMKIWHNSFLLWLESEGNPYFPKSLDDQFDSSHAASHANESELEQVDAPQLSEFILEAERLLSSLKEPYQVTFKKGYIWYKDHWLNSPIGYKELSQILGKSTSTLQEHVEKISQRDFVRPLMENFPQERDLLRKVFNHFREKYSEYNPEKTHPEFFSKVKES